MSCHGHDCNHIHHYRGLPRNITIAFKSGFPHYATTHAGHEPSQYQASSLLSNKAKDLWPKRVDTCSEDCKCQFDTNSIVPDSDIITPEPVTVDNFYVDDPGFGINCYWTISGIVDLTTKKWKGTCIKDGAKHSLVSADAEGEGDKYDKMGLSVELIRKLGLEETIEQKLKELESERRHDSV